MNTSKVYLASGFKHKISRLYPEKNKSNKYFTNHGHFTKQHEIYRAYNEDEQIFKEQEYDLKRLDDIEI